MSSLIHACAALVLLSVASSSCSSDAADAPVTPDAASTTPPVDGAAGAAGSVGGGHAGTGGASGNAGAAGGGAGGVSNDTGGGAGVGGVGTTGGSGGSGGSAAGRGGGGQVDGSVDAATVEASVIDGAVEAAADVRVPPKSFVCTQFVGLVLTSQWYLAGFESLVPAARYQLKFAEHAYVDEWAKPNSPFWDTAVSSPCSEQSMSPDRVVFVALSWTIMAQKDWETALTADVDNLKARYPKLGSIELMTIVRGPGNKACGNPNTYAESTHVPAALDEALTQVAAKYPGLVSVAPKFEVSACSDYTGVGPHLTAAGNAKMAKLIGAHYAK